MRFKPLAYSFNKGKLLYRGIRYRRGYGVHSPFVYNLITRVIEERCPYYCFQEIERVRKTLFFNEQEVEIQKKGRMRLQTVGQFVREQAISPKKGALLFRLTNFFKPKRMIQLGVPCGISTLYLTAYATDLQCIAIEKNATSAEIARMAMARGERTNVTLWTGHYESLISSALEKLRGVDFLYLNLVDEGNSVFGLLQKVLPYIHNGSVLVVEGIWANAAMRTFWRTLRSDPHVSVTIDLYTAGLAVFDTRLHKRNYIVYF